jgi:hypothetical protein
MEHVIPKIEIAEYPTIQTNGKNGGEITGSRIAIGAFNTKLTIIRVEAENFYGPSQYVRLHDRGRRGFVVRL